MTLTINETSSGVLVSFEGSAQVDEAEAIAHELRKLLNSEAPLLTLELDGVTSIDVSFFQLVIALSDSLTARHRALRIPALPDDHIVSRTSALLGIGLKRFMPALEAGK
jgi:anti-anti-sigma regulatory factor